MKLTDVLKLQDYVNLHRSELEAGKRGTIAQCAAMAAEALGCKVPSGCMAQMMKECGIATKRLPKGDAVRLQLIGENERLVAENNKLRATIAKVLASKLLPDDLRDIIFATLPNEMREAIVSR